MNFGMGCGRAMLLWNFQPSTSLNENKHHLETSIHTLEEDLHAKQKNNTDLNQTLKQYQNEQIKLSEKHLALKTMLMDSQGEKDKLHKQLQHEMIHRKNRRAQLFTR